MSLLHQYRRVFQGGPFDGRVVPVNTENIPLYVSLDGQVTLYRYSHSQASDTRTLDRVYRFVAPEGERPANKPA